MKTQRALDAVAFEQRLALSDLFNELDREIFSLEEQAKMGFVEGGIVEKREKNFRRVMVQERGKLFARGGKRALTVLCYGLGHELTFGDFQAARQGLASKLGVGLDNRSGERTRPRIGEQPSRQKIELLGEKGAAVENSSRPGQEEFRYFQVELPDNLANLIEQTKHSKGEDRSGRKITRFGSLGDDPKYFGKDYGGLFARAIHELIPCAGKGAKNFLR